MRAAILFLLTTLAVSAADPSNLVRNGDFAAAAADGVPAAWTRRTFDKGVVRTGRDGELAYVSVGVVVPGEDSILQQSMAVADDAVAVDVDCQVRGQGIETGDKEFMRGHVQGRWLVDGKESGPWINIASIAGTQPDWSARTRRCEAPAGTGRSFVVRLAVYGIRAGALEVAAVAVVPVSQAQQATEQAKFRPAEAFGEPVSDQRFARLSRGINLSHWLAQVYNVRIDEAKGGYRDDHAERWITAADLAFLRRAGFTHVRLSIEPASVGRGSALDPAVLARIDRAMALIRASGLAVVVDPHPQQTLKELGKDVAAQDALADWWTAFATHLATTDPELVFLEILNEPGGVGFYGAKWSAFQDRLATTIRAAAPRHTLIANPGGWQAARDFAQLVAHPDRNIVYACHFYEPMQFTHQGAVWMRDWYHPLREVPWPFGEGEIEGIYAAMDTKDATKAKAARGAIRQAVQEGLGTIERVDETLSLLADWTKSQQRRMVVGEFGVKRPATISPSGLRYLSHVRRAMETRGLGWCLWDYAGTFALTDSTDPGKRTVSPALLEALGLDPKAQP